MKEQFCSYEISLKLKELGFDEECLTSYDTNKQLHSIFNIDTDDLVDEYLLEDTSDELYCFNSKVRFITAPLWQQVIDWFREKHDMHISVENVNRPTKGKWIYEIYKLPCGVIVLWDVDTSSNYDTYEEAREAAILKCIELCNKLNN